MANDAPTLPRRAALGLLLLLVVTTIVAEARLRLHPMPTLVPDDHGHTATPCESIYDALCTQAAHYDLAAISLGMLALVVTLASMVVTPSAPPASGQASLLDALRAQPKVPLTFLASVLIACTVHRVSLQDGARELAGAAIDAMTAKPPLDDRERVCLGLRADWERKLGDATSSLVRGIELTGAPSPSKAPAVRAAVKGAAQAQAVESKAELLTRRAAASGDPTAIREGLEALVHARGEALTSVDATRMAIDAATRAGAPPEVVAPWQRALDDAEDDLAAALDRGDVLLDELPVAVPPDREALAPVASIGDAAAGAAQEVGAVAVAVEQRLREDP